MNVASINQLNNEAIALLERGDSPTAVAILKRALATLLEAENEGRVVEDATSSSVVQSVPIACIDAIIYGSTTSDDDLLDMYPRAFTLVTYQDGVGSFHQTILVILYNLALSFDAMALAAASRESSETNTKSTAAWHKNAIKLYETALQVACDRGRAEVNAMSCVLLAATNNLGRLQAQRLCFTDTKDCLRSVIKLYESTSDDTRRRNVEDFELLFNSLAPFLCVKDNLLPVAPAA
ncbi:expressed unknown protein [Seminavis robusta]|uniref:Uncharacterized protein n=1 Tax=Seminavis robusta TaxID=568900 RepID=A0A9N8H468_9STRA|nr:expressed unknown protein [Seminavis robusta]|eukprot:Sro5_g003980.1 n/a (236) ;mRNA; r:17184-17891